MKKVIRISDLEYITCNDDQEALLLATESYVEDSPKNRAKRDSKLADKEVSDSETDSE